jgi:hypothetical protein
MRPLLPEGFDVEKHFTPRYRPWQQRIAIAPDGDLFAALREGTVSIVTDTIEEFTEKGIRHVPASRLITITARRRSSFPVVWRTPAEINSPIYANTQYCHLLEQMGRGYGRVRVPGERGLKRRIAKGIAKRLNRLPHGGVEEHRASSDPPMQLSRDESWLGLQKGSIGGPRLQQRVNVLGRHLERVDQNDRADLLNELVSETDALVHLNALQHHVLPLLAARRACAAGCPRG